MGAQSKGTRATLVAFVASEAEPLSDGLYGSMVRPEPAWSAAAVSDHTYRRGSFHTLGAASWLRTAVLPEYGLRYPSAFVPVGPPR